MKGYKDGLLQLRFLVLVLLVFSGLFFKNLTKLAEVEIKAHLKLVSSIFISSDNPENCEFSSNFIEL